MAEQRNPAAEHIEVARRLVAGGPDVGAPSTLGRTSKLARSAISVDDLPPEGTTVDRVICDLQGTDQRAIAGMRRTIETSPPTMLVEFWPPGIRDAGEDSVEPLSLYSGLGYTVRILGRSGDELRLDPGAQQERRARVVVEAKAAPGQYVAALQIQP
jgi:hypothetical protein